MCTPEQVEVRGLEGIVIGCWERKWRSDEDVCRKGENESGSLVFPIVTYLHITSPTLPSH